MQSIKRVNLSFAQLELNYSRQVHQRKVHGCHTVVGSKCLLRSGGCSVHNVIIAFKSFIFGTKQQNKKDIGCYLERGEIE